MRQTEIVTGSKGATLVKFHRDEKNPNTIDIIFNCSRMLYIQSVNIYTEIFMSFLMFVPMYKW
jgi:hypothetical protein